jgi:hypothetical protein
MSFSTFDDGGNGRASRRSRLVAALAHLGGELTGDEGVAPYSRRDCLGFCVAIITDAEREQMQLQCGRGSDACSQRRFAEIVAAMRAPLKAETARDAAMSRTLDRRGGR